MHSSPQATFSHSASEWFFYWCLFRDSSYSATVVRSASRTYLSHTDVGVLTVFREGLDVLYWDYTIIGSLERRKKDTLC
jgi:hypothetical protein